MIDMNVLLWDSSTVMHRTKYKSCTLLTLYYIACTVVLNAAPVQGRSEALKPSINNDAKEHNDDMMIHHDDHDDFKIYDELTRTESFAAVEESLDIFGSNIKAAVSEVVGSGDHQHEHDHDISHIDLHDHSGDDSSDSSSSHHPTSHQRPNPPARIPHDQHDLHSDEHDGHSHTASSVNNKKNVDSRHQSESAKSVKGIVSSRNNGKDGSRKYVGWMKDTQHMHDHHQENEDGGHAHDYDGHAHDHDDHGGHSHDYDDHKGHAHDHDYHEGHAHDHDDHGGHAHDHDYHEGHAHDYDDHEGHAHDHDYESSHAHHGHSHGGKGRKVSEITSSDWLVASTSILIISFVGVLSVGFLPLLSNERGETILQGFICVAVGTLVGDSFIHLAPHALMNGHSSESTWKGFLASIVVIGFITLDKVLSYIGVRGHGHSHTTNFAPILKPEEAKLEVDTEDSFSQTSTVLAEDCGSMSDQSILQGSHHGHGKMNNTCLMVIIGDAIHNFADGIAIGAAFSIGYGPGISTSIAVLCHELPHEIGDFAILIQNGMKTRTALMYNLISSITGFLGMCLGMVLGSSGEYSAWMIAGIMGVFLYVALVSMLPEITADSKTRLATNILGMILGVVLLLIIGLYEDTLVNILTI